MAAPDVLDTADPANDLRACCASPAWLTEVLAGRPYPSIAELTDRSDAVIAELPWDEIELALAAHPRIGERAAGNGLEATWSRAEQSAAGRANPAVSTAIHAGNIAYEDRFGRVFLICASGLSGEQILQALTERVDHDEATEQAVVRHELAAIVRLRLGKAINE